MAKPEHHFILSDEDLIKVKDAARVVEELEAARPAEMAEFFYAGHYWDLLDSLRDVLEMLDLGITPEHGDDSS